MDVLSHRFHLRVFHPFYGNSSNLNSQKGTSPREEWRFDRGNFSDRDLYITNLILTSYRVRANVIQHCYADQTARWCLGAGLLALVCYGSVFRASSKWSQMEPHPSVAKLRSCPLTVSRLLEVDIGIAERSPSDHVSTDPDGEDGPRRAELLVEHGLGHIWVQVPHIEGGHRVAGRAGVHG